MRAHREGHPMVTGTILNGTRSPAGWASYFLDHATVLPQRPTESLDGPPAHCSYVREHLFDAGGFREDLRTGEGAVVNKALWQTGHRALRASDVRLYHHSPCRTTRRLVAHHFACGRGLGRIVLEDLSSRPLPLRVYFAIRFAVLYVPNRLFSTSKAVGRWGGPLRRVYRRVLPLVALGTLAALAGVCLELFLTVARLARKGRRRLSAAARRRLSAAARRSALPTARRWRRATGA